MHRFVKKMERQRRKFTVSSLILLIKLVELTEASCQLQVIVRNTNPQSRVQLQLLCDSVHGECRAQLQLPCDSTHGGCQQIDDTTCNVESDLGITEDTDCSDNGCTRLFNLCENSCINDNGPRATSLYLKFPGPPEATKVVGITHTTDNVCPTTIGPCISTTPALTTTAWSHCLTTTTTTILPTTTMTVGEISTNTKTTKIISTVTLSSVCAQPHTTTKPRQNVTRTSSVTSALGALIGILIVLLAFVTTALVWTCWMLKKRGGMKDVLIRNNFANTPGVVRTNYDSDTLKRLQNPLYEEAPVREHLETGVELQTPGAGEKTEETGPTYEIIPLPSVVNKKSSKKNGKFVNNRQGILIAGSSTQVRGASATQTCDSTSSSVRHQDESNMNNSHQPEIKKQNESSERRGNANHYSLLNNAHVIKVDESLRESVQEGKNDDKDYEDLDEEETENVYHVLEGPTPVMQDEENEKQAIEVGAYEIPIALLTKT